MAYYFDMDPNFFLLSWIIPIFSQKNKNKLKI
jgi:hypothetical protein